LMTSCCLYDIALSVVISHWSLAIGHSAPSAK
jgi:hypothetical protein